MGGGGGAGVLLSSAFLLSYSPGALTPPPRRRMPALTCGHRFIRIPFSQLQKRKEQRGETGPDPARRARLPPRRPLAPSAYRESDRRRRECACTGPHRAHVSVFVRTCKQLASPPACGAVQTARKVFWLRLRGGWGDGQRGAE